MAEKKTGVALPAATAASDLSSFLPQPIDFTKFKKKDGTVDYMGLLNQQFNAAGSQNAARLQKMYDLTNTYGTAALNRNTQLTANQLGGNQQDLINRGLNNTTIAQTTERGIQREGAQRVDEIEASKQQQQLGVLNQVSNTYPDLGMYAQLLQQPGSQLANQQALQPQAARSGYMGTIVKPGVKGYSSQQARFGGSGFYG